MKLRRLTWINWFELLVGAMLPTWCFGIGLIIMPAILLPSAVAGLRSGDYHNSLGLIFYCMLFIVGALALATLWLVILVGPEFVTQHWRLRWIIGIALLLGAVDGAYVLAITMPDEIGRIMSAQQGWGRLLEQLLLFSVLLGPIGVTLRYLPALFRRRG